MINDQERQKKIQKEMKELGIHLGGMWEWDDDRIAGTPMKYWDRLCLIGYVVDEYVPIAVFAGVEQMRKLTEAQALIAQKAKLEVHTARFDRFDVEIRDRNELLSIVGNIESNRVEVIWKAE